MASTNLIHHTARVQAALCIDCPAIGLAVALPESSVLDRLHKVLPSERIPAHTPIVLLFCCEPLSLPDTISIKGSSRTGSLIELQVELRRFDGTLHLNTVLVPIVELDLGALEPDRYEVVVDVAELSYSEFGHPENAIDAGTRRTNFSFLVERSEGANTKGPS